MLFIEISRYKVGIFCVMEIIQKNLVKLILLAKLKSVLCNNKNTLIV
jgi:hypothetical protein